MGKFLQLFKQTITYGIATVFPRIISVILVRVHTDKSVISEVSEFGTLSLIFSYIILFNVILSYGLETSFFRFYNKEKNKKDVLNTAAVSILISSFLFASIFSIFKINISHFTGISTGYLSIIVWILVADALTVIPFAYLRLKGSGAWLIICRNCNRSFSSCSINQGWRIFSPIIGKATSSFINITNGSVG